MGLDVRHGTVGRGLTYFPCKAIFLISMDKLYALSCVFTKLATVGFATSNWCRNCVWSVSGQFNRQFVLELRENHPRNGVDGR